MKFSPSLVNIPECCCQFPSSPASPLLLNSLLPGKQQNYIPREGGKLNDLKFARLCYFSSDVDGSGISLPDSLIAIL